MPYYLTGEGIELVDEDPQESMQIIANKSVHLARFIAWTGLSQIRNEDFYIVLNAVYNYAMLDDEFTDGLDISKFLQGMKKNDSEEDKSA